MLCYSNGDVGRKVPSASSPFSLFPLLFQHAQSLYGSHLAFPLTPRL
jgi:hypothetical protein